MPGAEIILMNKKAIALLSGGLDSTLAVCLVKEQGIEIEAINFQTMFGCCKDDARRVAYDLGIRLTLLKVGDDYLKMVQKPKYGYGRGVNPCVDCRIYMFDLAKKFMEQAGASFLISGEVLDQRPMSQKMGDFKKIESEFGLEGLILRPLSAKKLPVTKPEEAGIVDRSRLFGIQGRSRQELLQMADRFGIKDPPSPSAGCALTSPAFAKKVRDIFKHRPGYERWEFEILKTGRHFRLDSKIKVLIARNQNENEYLEYLHPPRTALLSCKNFSGPHALLMGDYQPEHLQRAGALILRYAQQPLPDRCEIQMEKEGGVDTFWAEEPATEELVQSLRIV